MLRKNRNKKSKHLKNIKNIIISQSPPQLMEERQVENSELQEEFQEKSENMKVFANKENKEIVPADEGKMRNLQERVKNLEKILLKISEYIESIEDGENEEGEKL